MDEMNIYKIIVGSIQCIGITVAMFYLYKMSK